MSHATRRSLPSIRSARPAGVRTSPQTRRCTCRPDDSPTERESRPPASEAGRAVRPKVGFRTAPREALRRRLPSSSPVGCEAAYAGRPEHVDGLLRRVSEGRHLGRAPRARSQLASRSAAGDSLSSAIRRQGRLGKTTTPRGRSHGVGRIALTFPGTPAQRSGRADGTDHRTGAPRNVDVRLCQTGRPPLNEWTPRLTS